MGRRASATSAGQRSPLCCRTSPPQGGRLAVTSAFANHQRWKAGGTVRLPISPQSGGDVRQDRGGAKERGPCAKVAGGPRLVTPGPISHPRQKSRSPSR
ncbi:hypothetical protein EN885_12600 [Mesorhizobium sp. M6A.T.Cr.TU.014.01.1.1]|nr:hypothetical protein EN885_12600 [Mesorhizobium sp. M6A.T.Cr.TU.014.01.1.1]RWP96755.1 MAG: hypothetical protein EOR90_29390 [Mesorhizobium sp.]RWQ02947.1 MAG: hypothetical protein EOR91_19870 [Mesorhizobium sp.]